MYSNLDLLGSDGGQKGEPIQLLTVWVAGARTGNHSAVFGALGISTAGTDIV